VSWRLGLTISHKHASAITLPTALLQLNVSHQATNSEVVVVVVLVVVIIVVGMLPWALLQLNISHQTTNSEVVQYSSSTPCLKKMSHFVTVHIFDKY